MDSLKRFSAGSANDETHKELWVKGASLIIGQFNSLSKFNNYNPNIIDIGYFNNNFSSALKSILDKHGSDKANSHNYNIVYAYIFNILGVTNNLNILEIGMGTNNPSLVSTMGRWGKPGASLYSWNEYLPNSNIYGADIDKNILFQSDSIKTAFVDQLDINTFTQMQDVFKNVKYDLIIDDGLHSIGANFNTLLFALDNIKSGGWIVIEDILIVDNWFTIDYILKNNTNYKTYIVKTYRAYIYLVNKL
jgi:hypothetical protein